MLTHEQIQKAYRLMCQKDYQNESSAPIYSKPKGRVIKINRKTMDAMFPELAH